MKKLIFPVFVLFIVSCGQEEASEKSAENTSQENDSKEIVKETEKKDPIVKRLLSPTEFKIQMETEPGIVLDVRTEEEYNSGYIDGAVNIDFYSNSFQDSLKKIDNSQPIYVYCHGGGRSAKTVNILKENGFTNIYDLDGGMSAWKVNDLEVVNP